MTRVYLIRHGHTDAIGRVLTGRAAGLHINRQGEEAARKLADLLRNVPFAAIYTSPMERTRETATLLNLTCPSHTCEEMNEVDFGEWTGLTFDVLDQIGAWKTWVSKRSESKAPSGESLLQVQQRAVAFIQELQHKHPESAVAVVTHGDVIRAALCHYFCMSLDCIEQIEISPASFSVVQLSGTSSRVLHMNVVPG